MGEYILDVNGEDAIQSSEGVDEWSTFSSADWTEPQQDDEGFSDLSGLQDKSRKEELSTRPVTETGTFQFPENVRSAVLHIYMWLHNAKIIQR